MSLKSGNVYFSEYGGSFSIPESISLFGLSVSFYGLFLVLAALVGIFVTKEAVRRKKQNPEWNLTLLTIVIVTALLGARIYYVMFEWQKFVREPWAVLNFRSGGLSYFGALFGAWFAVKWFCGRKNAEFSQSSDSLCLGAAAAAPLVWTGCAFVREPLGCFYEGLLALRIEIDYLPLETEGNVLSELRSNAENLRSASYVSMHPVALYGVGLSLVVFAVLCFYAYKRKQPGAVFTMYLFLNALLCMVLEYFRAERYCIWGTDIPANYIVAGVLVLTVLFYRVRSIYISKKSKNKIFTKG